LPLSVNIQKFAIVIAGLENWGKSHLLLYPTWARSINLFFVSVS
jgi:hypothetical protein